jgi:hypothetical protein
VEHDEQADRLEREAEKLERESERVGSDIDDARREWERKQEDNSVPGAQHAPDDEEDGDS